MRRVGESPRLRVLKPALLLALACLLAGCATPRPATAPARRFAFPQDAFAHANELNWIYRADPATGRMIHTRREPPPDYSLRCVPMTRAARQFLVHARFDPAQPPLPEAEARARVRRVLSRDPRAHTAAVEPVVIPGFAGLREFSAAHGALLKDECGGAWQSYLQRGNWRVVLPFTRAGQRAEAARLVEQIRAGRAPIVHLVRQPRFDLNHAILLHAVEESVDAITFTAYDPNAPERPLVLVFDRRAEVFRLPPCDYFIGGEVRAYEIFRGMFY